MTHSWFYFYFVLFCSRFNYVYNTSWHNINALKVTCQSSCTSFSCVSILSEKFIPRALNERFFCLPSSSNYCKTASKRDEKHSAVLNIISCDVALTKVSSSYSCNIIIHAAFRANFKRFVCPCGIKQGISRREVGLSLHLPKFSEKAAINGIYIVLLSNRVIELSTK